MTETSCPVATGWDPPNDATCGSRRDGYTIRLADDLDQEVPVGEPGEMLIRTDAPWTQMDGYHNMPEATVAAWRNNWLHTGDLFRLDADGNYYFLERKKDAIRRRGENISSYEVENVVNEYPPVLESAAVAVPSEWGEDEVLVAVVAKEGHEVDPGELSRFLADRLPKFMLPRYIRLMAELPKTPTQKIQKVEIRKAGVDGQTWDRGTAGR
jgi:crotonobetaine/carnitine-CoA ligase